MYPADTEALAELLRAWTTTPGRCWFCIWDGYGWIAGREGPRVHLPARDYLLYGGPVEAAVATVALAGHQQTANLWWPEDRAWCVATEIDLLWTYVGGPAGLIERLVSDDRIEALPAGPEDNVAGVEDWVRQWAAQATTDLLAGGAAVVTTSRGTMRAWLTRPAVRGSGILRTQWEADNGGSGSGSVRLQGRSQPELREAVRSSLTWGIVGLVER